MILVLALNRPWIGYFVVVALNSLWFKLVLLTPLVASFPANAHLNSDGGRIYDWFDLLSKQDLLVRNQLYLCMQHFYFFSTTSSKPVITGGQAYMILFPSWLRWAFPGFSYKNGPGCWAAFERSRIRKRKSFWFWLLQRIKEDFNQVKKGQKGKE